MAEQASGKCNMCKGTGQFSGQNCVSCKGTGRCAQCQGSGNQGGPSSWPKAPCTSCAR